MPCAKCLENPHFHSFKCIGKTKDDLFVFYSKPSLSVERELTEKTIPNYLAHLEEASGNPWVWVFDSKGLENLKIPNPKLMRYFYQVIHEKYRHVLKKIYLLNMNWKVSLLLSMIRPFLCEEAKNKFVYCDTLIPLIQEGINLNYLNPLNQDDQQQEN